MQPPPSDALAAAISRTIVTVASVQPRMTVWPRSTTGLRPCFSASIFACTPSTTSARKIACEEAKQTARELGRSDVAIPREGSHEVADAEDDDDGRNDAGLQRCGQAGADQRVRRRRSRARDAHSASGMLAGSTKSDHASQTPSCATCERRVSRGARALGCPGTTHRERRGVVGIESYVVVRLDKHATPRSAHGDGNAEQELETDARGSTRASGA